jgi:hypothetical protein
MSVMFKYLPASQQRFGMQMFVTDIIQASR